MKLCTLSASTSLLSEHVSQDILNDLSALLNQHHAPNSSARCHCGSVADRRITDPVWSKNSFGLLLVAFWQDAVSFAASNGRVTRILSGLLSTLRCEETAGDEKHPDVAAYFAPPGLRKEASLQGERFMYQGRTPRSTWLAFQLSMDSDIARNPFDDSWVFRDFSGPLYGNVVP